VLGPHDCFNAQDERHLVVAKPFLHPTGLHADDTGRIYFLIDPFASRRLANNFYAAVVGHDSASHSTPIGTNDWFAPT
jgi:hypothetical protein